MIHRRNYTGVTYGIEVCGQKRFVSQMLKQRQERARTNAYRCSSSATQQGRRAVKCSQEGCLQQYTSSLGHYTYSSMYNSLEGASNVFRHSVNRRQNWDGRVYHHPALLTPASNRQLRHSITERVNRCSAANCCGCWVDKSPSVAKHCMQHSTEELELVSLLQDISDCWSPDGWLPVVQGSRSCRPQLVQASSHSACQTPSRKRSNCSMQRTTADKQHAQLAASVSQQSAAEQPNVNTSAPASSTVDTVKHFANGVTADTCRNLHSAALGGNVDHSKCVCTPPPADPSQGDKVAAADAACISRKATAAESGSALGSPEAAAAEAALAHDNREAAAGEADAATMAAWLIQKPSLLQGVLGHLESLAASAAGKISILSPSSDPSAGLLTSSGPADKLSVDGTGGIQSVRASSLPASSLPPQANVTAEGHQPHSVLSSQHTALVHAEVQQSDSISHQSSHSVTGLSDLDQQEAACASTSQQQQCNSCHLPGPLESQGGGEGHHGSCGAESPDPVQATDRALLEHCAAGRYDEARVLLREGAQIDTADAEGNAPLMLASRAGHGRLVKLLVRKRANPDALNAEGKTAEQLATQYHHKGIATFLRDSYASSHGQSKP